MRRVSSVIVTALIATGVFALAPATAAFASCPEVGDVSYTFTNVSTSRILSNLRSDYLKGPGTITYTKNTTGTVTASLTASVSAEAGVVFAKASTSIGVSVGKSWSKGDTWSYSKPVPSGKTARLVMWHESRKFTVKKTQIVAPCNVKTVYTASVNAPRTANSNVWDLQYK